MKTLTVSVPDDLYQNAELRAAKVGSTLTQQVVKWLADFVRRDAKETIETPSEASPSSSNVFALLDCLDKAQNTQPIGQLRRDDLYDRNIVR